MAIENGIVVKAGLKGGDVALVKTVQPSACKSCSARNNCNPSAKGKEREVEALNVVNANEGDLIQISMETGALLMATFLLYIFPVICLLIGASIGHAIGLSLDTSSSTASAIGGIICFTASIFLVRKMANRMAIKQRYQPKITRILSRGRPPEGHRPGAIGCL